MLTGKPRACEGESVSVSGRKRRECREIPVSGGAWREGVRAAPGTCAAHLQDPVLPLPHGVLCLPCGSAALGCCPPSPMTSWNTRSFQFCQVTS